jgi:mono/diheme cytochrome c family protein
VRGLSAGAAALLAALLAAACARAPVPDPDGARAYLGDTRARRAAMEASLAGVANAYADLRRARYASGGSGDWERLPAWNPRVEPLALADLDGGAVVRGDSPFSRRAGEPRALALPAAAAATGDALRALGAAAFFRYPAQLLPAAVSLGRAELARYGLVADGARPVGGLVRAEMADGSARLACTCATCHVGAGPDGAPVAGLGNAALDLGGWLADSASPAAPRASTDALRAWGRGRVDVVTAAGRLPVALPDLRPTRLLSHLHYEADVAQRDVASLAIRIETLLITAHGQALRPPREVALGLALYLWSLAPAAAAEPAPGGAAARGQTTFRARCAGCHAGDGFTGPPVDADAVGTDPAAAEDPDRGTGRYRVPSLRGVAARGLLLHDGSARGLDDLLDPARAAAGHAFGRDLAAPERADLVAYVRTL